MKRYTDPSNKPKLQLTLKGPRQHWKLATNLLLQSVVPIMFLFLYPTFRSFSGGEDLSDIPYIVYVVLPYISISSQIVCSILFGFRLHSLVKVWSFKCLHKESHFMY